MRARRGIGAVYWDNDADLFGGPGSSGYDELWSVNDNARIDAREVA